MNPWQSPLGSKIWKNSTQFMTFLRGCLRLGWKRHPLRIAVLNAARYQIPNPNPKGKKETVWGFDCACCGKTFVISEGQVDHITPAGKLNSVEDVQGFVERLLFVTEDDLRLVCKGCNNALAMSDKQGISYELALSTKQAIQIENTEDTKEWLLSKGIQPASNAKLRRKQIIDYLSNKEST